MLSQKQLLPLTVQIPEISVGDYAWTVGTLPDDGDINSMLIDLGMLNREVDGFVSYALIVIQSPSESQYVNMGVSSDDFYQSLAEW